MSTKNTVGQVTGEHLLAAIKSIERQPETPQLRDALHYIDQAQRQIAMHDLKQKAQESAKNVHSKDSAHE